MKKNKVNVKEVVIDGETYVPISAVKNMAESTDGLPYVIVRTYSAGVHAGHLKSKNGKESVLINARRIWYWAGAASISQLAVDGTSDPGGCKFPCEVPEIELTETIERIPCTEKAMNSIKNVPVWTQ